MVQSFNEALPCLQAESSHSAFAEIYQQQAERLTACQGVRHRIHTVNHEEDFYLTFLKLTLVNFF